MKNAICISGLPRGITDCSSSIIDNIIKPNDCDVFIHSWFNKEDVGKKYRTTHPNFKSTVVDSVDTLISEIYRPIFCQIEPQKQFNVDEYFSIFQPHDKYFIFAIQSMFYSILQASLLKQRYEEENNFKYDAVCRLRFDMIIEKPILFNNLDLSKINIYNDCKHEANCCNDHIAVSSSENMDIYSNVYTQMKKLYDEGAGYCAEVFLGRWLTQNEIELKHEDFKYLLLERT